MIILKSEEQVEMIRRSGKILARIIEELKKYVRPGVSTLKIEEAAIKLFEKEGVVSAFKGYRGFPAYICTSVNEGVVHGIPDERRLADGDIASLDVGINYQGFFSDCALTIALGDIDKRKKKLLEVTKKALVQGIRQARPGNHLSDISHAIQVCAESAGFSVVRQFVGHGTGLKIHEDPEIPNFGPPHKGPVLKAGMVLAIEPMVNMGTWEVEVLDDGWSAVTKDRFVSCHFEHTVAVTDSGPEILTRL